MKWLVILIFTLPLILVVVGMLITAISDAIQNKIEYKKLINEIETRKRTRTYLEGEIMARQIREKYENWLNLGKRRNTKMKEYHKIETLFERDEKTKKLIMGKFRNPTIEYLKDCKWQFTEKVDGTNIRIHWDGHKVNFAGRTDKAEIPKHLRERLEELFGGDANEQIFEQYFGENEVILFGEGYGYKIQTNGYIDGVDFILFDVLIGDNYQARENVEMIANYFGLSVVPIVMEGTLQEGIDWVLNNRKSIIAKNGADIEGLVARPIQELKTRSGARVIVKIKYKDFFNH